MKRHMTLHFYKLYGKNRSKAKEMGFDD